jgi:hypothetical protein
MKRHIGTKLINAEPMTRLAYNELRGWQLPADENGDDEGYLVEYIDGGAPNSPLYTGYISWSPKEQFDNAYRPIDGMTFGLAIEALKQGKKVARTGWNGKKMFLFLTKDIDFETDADLECVAHLEGNLTVNSIVMKTADDKFVVGWLASQTDMLGEDWQIVE